MTGGEAVGFFWGHPNFVPSQFDGTSPLHGLVSPLNASSTQPPSTPKRVHQQARPERAGFRRGASPFAGPPVSAPQRRTLPMTQP